MVAGSRVDNYCLCTPSLAIDCLLEYRETRDGPVTALAFVKRKDGRGLAVRAYAGGGDAQR